jgi:ATP-dependent Clp protease ATP-binding subunit ClpB
MTSNLGTEQIERQDTKENLRRKLLAEFRRHLRPEFLNRIDEIVIFNHLSEKNMEKIVDMQFSQIMQRLNERGLRIELTDDAREFLAKEGYEPDFGARPLKRLVQKRVVDPLSLRILNGELKAGDKVEIGLKDSQIAFKKLKS